MCYTAVSLINGSFIVHKEYINAQILHILPPFHLSRAIFPLLEKPGASSTDLYHVYLDQPITELV